MLIDTHAHLDFPQFVDRIDDVLQRAAANKVTEVITIGIDLETSRKAISIASRYANVRATVGIHPHGALLLDSTQLGELADSEQVVAIGEVGLDYYRDRQPRDIQQACLRSQLDLAAKLWLPVVFHIRDAFEDFLAIASDYADHLPPSVLHCFSGDWPVAEQCLGLGWYLSVPGIVTFAKANVLQDVVRRAPLDRLLLETDSPYLAPVPFRGKDNEPAYLLHTAEKVAELKGLGLEALAAATMANAHRVFGINSEPMTAAGGGYGRS
jgi:TatD DNase family protein